MSNSVAIAGAPVQITATGQIFKGPGTLESLMVGTTTAGTMQFYDTNNGTTNGSTQMTPVLTLAAGQVVNPFMSFANGLYVVVGGTITAAAAIAAG